MTWMPANPGFNFVRVVLLKDEYQLFDEFVVLVHPVVALNIETGEYAYATHRKIETPEDSRNNPAVITQEIVAGKPTDFEEKVLIEAARQVHESRKRPTPPPRLSDLAPAQKR